MDRKAETRVPANPAQERAKRTPRRGRSHHLESHAESITPTYRESKHHDAHRPCMEISLSPAWRSPTGRPDQSRPDTQREVQKPACTSARTTRGQVATRCPSCALPAGTKPAAIPASHTQSQHKRPAKPRTRPGRSRPSSHPTPAQEEADQQDGPTTPLHSTPWPLPQRALQAQDAHSAQQEISVRPRHTGESFSRSTVGGRVPGAQHTQCATSMRDTTTPCVIGPSRQTGTRPC